MRLFWILIFILVVGCNRASGPEPGDVAPATPAEAGAFLGVPDDQSRKVGDEHPESALAHLETMTKVEDATYSDYLDSKKAGSIHADERRGRYVYFAVKRTRHVPFPDGGGAYFHVVERYKAPVPEPEKAYAKIAEEQGWLENYKRGKEILQELSTLSGEDRKKLGITAYRGERIALVGGVAPPGATNDLVTEHGYYLRIVNKAGKDLRPQAVWWEVLVSGKVLQVIPENKIIIIEVDDKSWVITQTG